METFPSIGSWIIDGARDTREGTPTQRSRFYSGYTQTVNRFTWVPKVFYRSLVNFTVTQRDTLDTFQTTVKYGHSIFNWNDVITSTVHQVRFAEGSCPLDFQPFAGRNDLWQCDLAFVQATPNELAYGDYTKLFHTGGKMIQIEDLAAGEGITDRPVYGTQYGEAFSKAGILTSGTPAGIDNSNTCVITLKNGAGSTIVTKTYNAANQPPTNDLADLGALSITELEAADIVTLTVTQGATANMPPFAIILE